MADTDPVAIVVRFLELSSSGAIDSAFALTHPSARFWISGRLVVSGDLARDAYRRLAAGTVASFPDGYRLTVRSITADGGRVAVESVGDGVRPSGQRYQPVYASFFEVSDGLIHSVREYLDTEYVAATFGLKVRG
jgi:ketosteroid isomerase-like protein